MRSDCIPMSHHLESSGAYSVHDLRTFSAVGYLELLLQEYGRLLIGRLGDTLYEKRVRRRGRRMEEGEEIDGLWANMCVSERKCRTQVILPRATVTVR